MQLTNWGAVTSLRYGRALTGYRTTVGGNVPVYGTNGVTGFTDEAMGMGPAVVVGRKGAYRGIHLARGPFWVIDTAFVLVPGPRIDPTWAYYALQPADMNGMDAGSAIPSTRRQDFAALPLLLPDRGTQLAIAQVLSALDDKIAANARVVESTDQLMTALVWGGGMAPTTVPLADIATLAKSVASPSAFESVQHFSLPAYDAGGLPVVEAGADIMSNKQILSGPAVLLSKLNPRIPRVWDVPSHSTDMPALVSTEFLVLEPRGVPTGALWAVLLQPEVVGRMQEMARGTSGSHQRVAPLDAMAMAVPDPRLLGDGTLAVLTAMSSRRWQAKLESRKIADLRDTLLPHLMSGRISVRQAESVVSEAL